MIEVIVYMCLLRANGTMALVEISSNPPPIEENSLCIGWDGDNLCELKGEWLKPITRGDEYFCE